MNPQSVLQERYPAANLIVYFAFLDACRQFEPEPQKGKTHEHHICPRKQFPEHIAAPENMITLYTALHQHAHRLLGKAVPELSKANLAWIAAGIKNAAKGGRKGGLHAQETHKKNGTGLFAPGMGMQAKGGRSSSREQKQAAGRKASATHKKNGTGWFAPENRSKAAEGGRKSTHLRWHVNRGITSMECSLCR